MIVDPIGEQITHVVVQENDDEHTEHLVPITCVEGSTPRRVRLRVTRADLAAMPHFVERQFKRVPMPYISYPTEHNMVWPYVLPDGAGIR